MKLSFERFIPILVRFLPIFIHLLPFFIRVLPFFGRSVPVFASYFLEGASRILKAKGSMRITVQEGHKTKEAAIPNTCAIRRKPVGVGVGLLSGHRWKD